MGDKKDAIIKHRYIWMRTYATPCGLLFTGSGYLARGPAAALPAIQPAQHSANCRPRPIIHTRVGGSRIDRAHVARSEVNSTGVGGGGMRLCIYIGWGGRGGGRGKVCDG